jgi:hypothetical protein
LSVGNGFVEEDAGSEIGGYSFVDEVAVIG